MTQPNWKHAAIGKFFDLSARAAGRRADLVAKMARRAELVSDLAAFDRELEIIEAHIAGAPILAGRGDDRNRTLVRCDELRDQIASRKALLEQATTAVNAALERNSRLDPLVDGCAVLLHRIGFLSREEAQI